MGIRRTGSTFTFWFVFALGAECLSGCVGSGSGGGSEAAVVAEHHFLTASSATKQLGEDCSVNGRSACLSDHLGCK